MRVAPTSGEGLVCGNGGRRRVDGRRGIAGLSLFAGVARPEPANDGDGSGHLDDLAGEDEGETKKARNVWRLFGQDNQRSDRTSPTSMMATTTETTETTETAETRGSLKKLYALGKQLSQ